MTFDIQPSKTTICYAVTIVLIFFGQV